MKTWHCMHDALHGSRTICYGTMPLTAKMHGLRNKGVHLLSMNWYVALEGGLYGEK